MPERSPKAMPLTSCSAKTVATLEQLRVDYLGKKGQITALLKGLGKLSAEERPQPAPDQCGKAGVAGLIGERKATLGSR